MWRGKYILFDLDGTLLPMDQDEFTNAYFSLLAKKLKPYGYNPEKLVKNIWAGTKAMIGNDGTKNNEEVFWDCFANNLGEHVRKDIPLFDEFYKNDFYRAKVATGINPLANKTIQILKRNGFKLVLATNPIFPAIATRQRIKWAGLDENDFELYTTYENSRYCKPNIEYYWEILRKINADPDECLMVGNDVSEDMVANELGMEVFLITDNLINKENISIEAYPKGGFEDLLKYIMEK